MLVAGFINHLPVGMLIDTGAAVTLMSRSVMQRLGLSVSQLDEPEGDDTLVGAGGGALVVLGSVLVSLRIGTKNYPHRVRVVDRLRRECLVGRDVLQGLECTIEAGQGRMRFMLTEGRCGQVRLQSNTAVPPRHELLVAARTRMSGGGRLQAGAHLLTGSSDVNRNFGVLIASAVVVPDDDRILVRIINPHRETVSLPRKLCLGTLEPVVGIDEVALQNTWQEDDPSLGRFEWEDSNADRGLLEMLQVDRSGLTGEQYSEVVRLIERHQGAFARSSRQLGRTTLMEHEVHTGQARPIFQYPRRLPYGKRAEAREIVEKMLKQGVIEPSASPWSAPIVLVSKKDGSTRFCVDYRKLNEVTDRDPFPLPRIDETLDSLGGAQFFSTLDLCSGYHQMPLRRQDKEKTAFSTPEGHYQFTVLPFGVCNGPSSFQRLMAVALSGLQWKTCLIYIDDIIVFGRTFGEHLARLEEVFERLEQAQLRLKPSKCFLFRKEVEFLGHLVTPLGVQTDPAKVAKVVDWPRPTGVDEVRAFLGLCGYYRRFVDGFAGIAAPLHSLTRAGRVFEWTERCTVAFGKLKELLTSAPVLAYPDFQHPFVLDVDASGIGLGAVLSQEIKGVERPVAYASRVKNECERRYASTKNELLGLVWAVRHFRCYLLGKKFVVRTDHQALQHLTNFKEPSAIIARWLEFLSEFEFEVVYRAGRAHANADGLSRRGKQGPAGVNVVEASLPSPFVQRRHWDQRRWQQEQGADPDLARLLTWLEAFDMPDSAEPDLTGASMALRSYWQGRDRLVVKNGVIYRHWEDPFPGKPSRELVLVPVQVRCGVLSEFHDHCGHQGVSRTYQQVHARFHWNGMKRDVEDWVASCVSCSQLKSPKGRGRGAPLQVTWTGYPLERLAMDLIPNLPETLNGNRHILVVVDYFTKWVEAYPMKRMDAVSIATVFVNEFVSRYGAPTSLHTDQGKNFDSSLFKQVCSLLGIRKTRTTAYHPSGDGLVERFNQTVEKVLAHYVSTHHRDWDLHLPSALMAYRATPQASTGYSPAYLLFGRELCLPADVAYGRPADEPQAQQPAEYVQKLRSRLEEAHAYLRSRLQSVHLHQATLHDRRATPVSFPVGSLVWLLVPAIPVGTSAKFARLWRGPFEVTDVLSAVTIRIKDTRPPHRPQVVHVNRLKRCYCRPSRLSGIGEDVEGTEGMATSETVAPAPPPRPSGYVPDATDLLYRETDGSERWEMYDDVNLPVPQHGPQVPVQLGARRQPVRNAGVPVRYQNFYLG